MSTPRPEKAIALTLLALSCTGLDPGAFEPKRSPEPEIAGYSFDAGSAPEAGGRGGSGAGRGSASGAGGASQSGAGEGGAPGEAGSEGMGDGGEATGGRASGGGSGSGTAGRGASGSGSAMGGRGGSGAAGRGGGGSGTGSGGGSGNGGGGGAGGVLPVVHALYFSEYVEGTSSYKALELTAREASALTGCRLVTYSNGAVTGANIALDGVVAKDETYVLCSSSLATLVGDVCDRTTNLTFNGDDALALDCEGAFIDVIGQIGVDPGDGWGSTDSTTLNMTLRRSCTAMADANGTDPFDPALEWTPAGVDAFDGLGVNACTGSPAP